MGKAKAGKFLFIISHSLSFDFTLIKSFQKVLIMNILCVNTLVFTMATNYLANNNDGKGLTLIFKISSQVKKIYIYKNSVIKGPIPSS